MLSVLWLPWALGLGVSERVCKESDVQVVSFKRLMVSEADSPRGGEFSDPRGRVPIEGAGSQGQSLPDLKKCRVYSMSSQRYRDLS